MTSKVQRVLDQLMAGPPLTVRQLAAKLGLARKEVARTVHALVSGGRLRSLPGRARFGSGGRPELRYMTWTQQVPPAHHEQSPHYAYSLSRRALATRSALEVAWAGIATPAAERRAS